MKKLLGLFAFMVYGVMVCSQIQNTVIGENLENAVFDSGDALLDQFLEPIQNFHFVFLLKFSLFLFWIAYRKNRIV